MKKKVFVELIIILNQITFCKIYAEWFLQRKTLNV